MAYQISFNGVPGGPYLALSLGQTGDRMNTSFKGLLVSLVALPVLLSFQNCTGVQFSGAGARLVAKGDVTGTDPAVNFVDSSGAPVIDLGDGGSSVPMNHPPGGSNSSDSDSGDTNNNDTADNTNPSDTADGSDSSDSSDTSDTADNSNDSSDSSENPVDNPDSNENPDVVENPDDGDETPDVTPEEPNRPGKNPDVAKGKKCDNSNRPKENVDSEDGGEKLFVCVLEGPGRSQLLHFENDAFNSRVSMPQAVCTTKFACESLVSQKFSVKLAHKRGACGRNPHMVTLSELEIMSLLGL